MPACLDHPEDPDPDPGLPSTYPTHLFLSKTKKTKFSMLGGFHIDALKSVRVLIGIESAGRRRTASTLSVGSTASSIVLAGIKDMDLQGGPRLVVILNFWCLSLGYQSRCVCVCVCLQVCLTLCMRFFRLSCRNSSQLISAPMYHHPSCFWKRYVFLLDADIATLAHARCIPATAATAALAGDDVRCVACDTPHVLVLFLSKML